MKEDILEQIVHQYLNLEGYFTVANVRYKPEPTDAGYISRQDAVASDIDVIGYNPLENGPKRVIAVSCKSWQDGFNAGWEWSQISGQKSYAGRERWRTYRELAIDKWAFAFKRKIRELTGQDEFEYWTACLHWTDPNNTADWSDNAEFKGRLTPHIRVNNLTC